MRSINILTLLPWDETGLALLRSMNTPDQKRHLGGTESEEKLLDRHARYLTYHRLGETEMLRIAVDGQVIGSIGYWAIERHGPAYETGWEILVTHHGHGYGTAAARLLVERLKEVAQRPYLFAFPAPGNEGSNGICRKLGFELVGVEETEYPKGVWGPHNVWRLPLT